MALTPYEDLIGFSILLFMRQLLRPNKSHGGHLTSSRHRVTLASPPTISNNRYYDLQGRRVVNPGMGVFVKDGKKIIIK